MKKEPAIDLSKKSILKESSPSQPGKKNYLNEQLSCPNYKLGRRASFHVFNLFQGEERENMQVGETTIIFLLAGELTLTYNKHLNKRLLAKEFLLLPPASVLKVKALDDSKIVSCRFNTQMQLCDYFRLDYLLPLCQDLEDDFQPLPFNGWIVKYLELLESYLEGGFVCSCLHRYKQQELFHLLRALYGKKELAAFFSPVMNKDMFFKDAVLKNYLQVHNVPELAEMMHYSLSGFKKKFERNFGQTPFSWMQQQRSGMILKDLKENQLSNKEIIIQYQFSSEARFYEFCKRHYGSSPSEIRKQK